MNSRTTKKILVAGVSVIVWAAYSQSFAQEAPGPRNTEAESSALSEVVVTARRRAEDIMAVPVAVSVLGGDALRQKSVQTVADVARNVPSFQMQPQAQGKNNMAYTIRSQRQSESVLTQDLSVAVYFADVTLARSQGANGALFDLSSVQVLKGPQGTLFGRNTTGGAVLVTPQSPTDTFEGYVVGRLGNYNQQFLEGVVNVPVNDRLQLRAGGQISKRDGYVKNLFDGRKLDDENTYSWRLSVRAEPIDNLYNNFIVNAYHVDENGAGPVLAAATPPATSLFPGVAASIAKQQAAGYYRTNSDFASMAKIQSTLISNTTEYTLGDVTLKNIFGYRYLSAAITQDVDGSPFPIFPAYDFVHEHQYSDELQVQGRAFDSRLNYIVGLYYFFEQGSNTNGNAPLNTERKSTGDIRNVSKSVFAQIDYNIRPNLSLTLGGRQTWDRREITWHNFAGPTQGGVSGPYVCALTTQAGVRLNPCTRHAEADFDKPTYTISLDWRPTPDILFYGAHRSGYRAGGFNLRANTPAQSIPFRPENVKDYEVGAKTRWGFGDVRGTFNVAAYHQEYKNIQRQSSLIINGLFAGSVIGNAAAAEIDGIELEGTVSPISGLEIGGFFSYSDPRYKSYPEVQSNGSILNLTNAPFAGAPRYSGGASIQYRIDAGDTGAFVLNTSIYAQTHTYAHDGSISRITLQPLPLARLKGWSVVNARVEWNEIMGSRLSAAVFGRNLLNRHYAQAGLDLIDNQLGTLTYWYGAPRLYGVEVKMAF